MADMNGNGMPKNGNGKPMPPKCDMCEGSGYAGQSCCCGYQGFGRHGFGWGILRIIVALIVLSIVFSFGVIVGEVKVITGSGFGSRWQGGYTNMGPGMMRGWMNSQDAPTSSR